MFCWGLIVGYAFGWVYLFGLLVRVFLFECGFYFGFGLYCLGVEFDVFGCVVAFKFGFFYVVGFEFRIWGCCGWLV